MGSQPGIIRRIRHFLAVAQRGWNQQALMDTRRGSIDRYQKHRYLLGVSGMVYGRRQFGLKREERAKCHKQSEVAGTRKWTIGPEEVVPWPRRRAGCVAGGRFAAAGRTSLCLRSSPLLQTDQVEGSVATFARVLFTLPHGILDLDLLHARYWVSTV